MDKAGYIELGIDNPGMEYNVAGCWLDHVVDHFLAGDSESALPVAERK